MTGFTSLASGCRLNQKEDGTAVAVVLKSDK
jgi:hypothetical protein